MARSFVKINFGGDSEDSSSSANDESSDSGVVDPDSSVDLDNDVLNDESSDEGSGFKFNFDKKKKSNIPSVPRFGAGADEGSSFGVSAGFDSDDYTVGSPSFDDFDDDFSSARSLLDEDEELDEDYVSDDVFVGVFGSSNNSDSNSDSVNTFDKSSVDNVTESVQELKEPVVEPVVELNADSVIDNGVSVDGDSSVADEEIFNPFLDDEDEGSSSVSSVTSSTVDSVGSDLMNPMLDDDEDDEVESFLGFGNSLSNVVEPLNESLSTTVDEGSSSVDLIGVPDSARVGSDSIDSAVSEKVREFASREIVSESRGNDDEFVAKSVPGEVADSVVVKRKRGPRFVGSGFARKNVTEVIVEDSDVSFDSEGSDSTVIDSSGGVDSRKNSNSVGVDPGRKSYRHVRENGRLNGKELEFFKNMGTSKSGIDSDRVRALRGAVDGVDSVAARKARNVLYAQAVGGADLLSRSSKTRFSEKDRDTLQLLALFRYMTTAHVARAFSQSVRTAQDRLARLRLQGLVIDKKVYGTRPIWYLTEAGMLLSGYDLTRITDAKITYSMFPHQFTVNHVAANVWGANVNVLNLDDFPLRNRVNERGDKVFGEVLTSELEIQSALGRMRMFDKADVFAPELKANVEEAFLRWERSGGVEFGLSPEMILGNEYMWALLPPANLRLAYHVPDLIVKRDRNADGSPESIAVEIEINNKASDNYEKTLRAYRADDKLFKKVIWVCKNVGPARKLEKFGKDLGLIQEGRLEILPVLTEDGVFKGRDLWLL